MQSGSPAFLCRGYGRPFVDPPKKGPVSDVRKNPVRRLRRERVGVREITPATGRSRSWVQTFVNGLYRDETPSLVT